MVLFAEKGVTTINDWVQNRNKCLLSLFPCWLRVGRRPRKCNLGKYNTTLLILYFNLNYNFLNILANLCLSKRPFEADCFQDYPPPTLPPRQVEIDSRGFFGLKYFSQVWCRLVSPIWRVSLSSNTNCQTWSFINTYFSSCCVNEAELHVWLLFKEIWTLTLQIASSKS